ncbi:MAG: HAD-IIA family hydrolase [Desulfurococcales archaeon]|nr:HAD-IIA family hydrolase [Desulfurococcales archaeon]
MPGGCYDALILDVDGVIWLEGTLIDENIKVVREAIDKGVQVVFLTNNATRSRKTYSILLSNAIGRDIGIEMVVNSAYSAAEWLLREKGPSRVYVVGEEGLVEELNNAGHTIFGVTEWRYADTVVVGLDRHLNYRKLMAAHKALTENNAFFLVTNRDPAYPVAEGTIPGAGALVSFLETSTGRKADYNAGKPGQWILDLALEKAGNPRNPLLVGDRIEIDIEMALARGMDSLLVLTGVTKTPPSKPRGFKVSESLGRAVDEGLVSLCRG